jgi:hypothetical protein
MRFFLAHEKLDSIGKLMAMRLRARKKMDWEGR